VYVDSTMYKEMNNYATCKTCTTLCNDTSKYGYEEYQKVYRD